MNVMENALEKKPQAEATRRILDAAAAIFAEVGFAGARVDEIAKRADINKALIYYHVGGKETLYERVIRDVLEDTAEQAAETIKDAHSPEERLRGYIRNITNFMNRHPHIAPILLREFASDWQHLPPVAFRTFQRLIGMLTEILRDGEAQGVFAPSAPIIVHFMVIAPLVMTKTVTRILSGMETVPESLQHFMNAFPSNTAEQIEEFVLRAVKIS